MGKKRIGLMLSSFGIGGAERQYWYLINQLDRSQFEVFVIQISHQKSRPATANFPDRTVVTTFEMKHKLDLGIAFRIARYVLKNKIELLQSLLFLDNQIAKLVGLLTWTPVITSVRGGPHNGKFVDWLEHHLAWLPKRIITNSTWLKGLLVKDGVNKGKIMVIYNGINPAVFQCCGNQSAIRKKFGISEGRKILTIVARLHPMKQHCMFFDVIKEVSEKVPDVLALVAGEGEMRQELEKYVDRLRIRGNVIFLGAVKGDLPELLHISDVLLLTSGWGESLPNALLEGMSAGVPIISTNIHGIPEIIDEGVNGFMVNNGDVKGMSGRVVEVLGNEALRRRLVSGGLEKIQNFSMDTMVKNYENLYTSVLGR